MDRYIHRNIPRRNLASLFQAKKKLRYSTALLSINIPCAYLSTIFRMQLNTIFHDEFSKERFAHNIPSGSLLKNIP